MGDALFCIFRKVYDLDELKKVILHFLDDFEFKLSIKEYVENVLGFIQE